SLVEICQRMMAKRPELRYDSASEVADRLTQWLADRGRTLRGGRVSSEQESGVGSGILSRFQVRPPSSKIPPPPPSSETISNRAADVDTTRLNGSSGVDLGDDEITLAPLDDDSREDK